MKVLRKQEIETANIQVGDQVIIPLAEIRSIICPRQVWKSLTSLKRLPTN